MNIPIEATLFHYLVWPVVLCVACRWWFGPLTRLSFAWVFLLGWLLLIHAQALTIYMTEYRYPEYLLSVYAVPAIVLLVAGPLLRAVGHQVPELADLPRSGALSERDAILVRIAPFCTVALYVLIGVYIVDIGVRNVAFFFLLTNPGSALDAMALRIEGLNSHISPILTAIYGYTRTLFLPLYAALATALFATGRMRWWHWAAVLGGAALFSVLTAAKAPMAFILAAAGTAGYIARPKRIGLGKLSLTFAVTLFIPALIYPLLSGDTGLAAIENAGGNLWRRITYVTSWTGAMYFDAFPALQEHQGASSNRLLARLANVPVESTPNWVYDRYLDTGILHGGSANTAFYASFYADWGSAGVVGGAILVGVTVLGLQLFFDRRRGRDAVSLGVRAATMVSLAQLMTSDFYGVALGRGMILLPLLLWGFDITTATFSPATNLDRAQVSSKNSQEVL